MEVAVHVESDDAKVVGAGHVRDDTLSAFPLFWHTHPHVPVPQLHTHTHTRAHCHYQTENINYQFQKHCTHTHVCQYLLRRGPLGLQFVLVETLLQHPAQAWHTLHSVEESWVLCCVLITLHSSIITDIKNYIKHNFHTLQ